MKNFLETIANRKILHHTGLCEKCLFIFPERVVMLLHLMFIKGCQVDVLFVEKGGNSLNQILKPSLYYKLLTY
jgi:hypothetical protein